ncbi:hypothetical protein AOZ06_38520 [Kibdelosporangium phytohabitans]|uniref:Ricin B lectin domain-containing protein n=1 Tax=Kibdelosporangium phytohabitans TaxID=860235 RepID=A0A0N7F4P2_9PSEU|nr:RICIN domain-containing protein [Kibdelosporangium phytohabitans]ALG11983.1 hypothetical protein AOZ06_38520 [Kibdelosporangium phytohabitans]
MAVFAAVSLIIGVVNAPAYSSQAGSGAGRAGVVGVSPANLDGPWHIVNRHSGKCLAVNWASGDERAWVVQHTCEYNAPYNEDWYFDGSRIINRNSGKCLAINWGSHDERMVAVQLSCDNSAPQNWTREVLGNGYSHFVNGNSGKCLAINWASGDERAWAVQHTCEYNAPYNEEWLVTY